MKNRNPEINLRSTRENIISLEAIAMLWGVRVLTIKKWIKQGKLPTPLLIIGRRKYYTEEQGQIILQFAQEQGYQMK